MLVLSYFFGCLNVFIINLIIFFSSTLIPRPPHKLSTFTLSNSNFFHWTKIPIKAMNKHNFETNITQKTHQIQLHTPTEATNPLYNIPFWHLFKTSIPPHHTLSQPYHHPITTPSPLHHHTPPHSTTFHHVSPHFTTPHHTPPGFTTPYHISPHFTTLHYIPPQSTTPHHTPPHPPPIPPQIMYYLKNSPSSVQCLNLTSTNVTVDNLLPDTPYIFQSRGYTSKGSFDGFPINKFPSNKF